jgi:carboxylesterase
MASAVDPRPIALGEGSRAVLLLHGLTGTPYEVEPIARSLHGRGFAVRVPLLAGHGSLADLEHSTRLDWYATAEHALSELREGGRRDVVILGTSMGGLLALRLAALRPQAVAGVVAASVPLELTAWRRGAISVLARLRRMPLLGRAVGALPKNGPDVRVARESRESPSLRGFPYPALAELVALQREVVQLLPEVRTPLLLLHGELDHSVPASHSARIAQQVGSAQVRCVLLPRSFHILGRDLDRDRVCAEVVRFAVSTLGDPQAPASAPTEET